MAKRHSARAGTLQAIFIRLEELVLANSGEDEFEEIFKLIVAKLWDEMNEATARFNALGSPEEIAARISLLLSGAASTWPGILEAGTESRLTPSHLKICVEALAPYSLHGAGFEVMDAFFEFLVSRGSKGNKGQYFTPRYVIEFCVRMMQPSMNELVVDPACGSGGFLVHTLDYVRRENMPSNKKLQNYCNDFLWGFDVDARAIRVAKALMILAGDGRSNIVHLNSLLKPVAQTALFDTSQTDGKNSRSITIEDVCRTRRRAHKGFDVVLTNPPFAGEVREESVLSSYDLGRSKVRVERDVLFIERCLDLLRPGGRMAIVLPHNKLSATSTGDLRRWLLTKAQILAVVGLGRHTFLPHTHQKAGVLFLRRLAKGEKPVSDYKIFFGVSDKDGKNSRGELSFKDDEQIADENHLSIWDRVDHDLTEIESAFHKFCNQEKVILGDSNGRMDN
ncbi:putative type I restriction enzymeP M protein [Abditibacteriota bacterium]|nr:putative type I restriction enzymeP M protein [Abditibacteriota bacterium]